MLSTRINFVELTIHLTGTPLVIVNELGEYPPASWQRTICASPSRTLLLRSGRQHSAIEGQSVDRFHPMVQRIVDVKYDSAITAIPANLKKFGQKFAKN
jgi:hypothetical protein